MERNAPLGRISTRINRLEIINFRGNVLISNYYNSIVENLNSNINFNQRYHYNIITLLIWFEVTYTMFAFYQILM